MSDGEFFFMPGDIARRKMAAYERDQDSRARARITYDKKNPDRNRNGRGHGAVKAQDKPFVFWDGEGPRDTGYSLFGNTAGFEICRPGPLSTIECLDLIIDTERENPDAIHVIYGGNYDASNILIDLPRGKLWALSTFNKVSWNGYRIEHVPGKWLNVRHGNITARIYDIVSFFDGSLVNTLIDWEIGPFAGLEDDDEKFEMPSLEEMATMSETDIIRRFKRLRGEFEYKDIAQIRIYMYLELKYGMLLIERVRDTFLQVGFLPRSWHGPGAIATMAMNRENVFDAMGESPPEVLEAARYAFAGGRFEDVIGGIVNGPVWLYDKNSAYPYYAAKCLPNLAKGQWRKGVKFEPGKFGVYHIRYRHKPKGKPTPEYLEDHITRLYPLFCRYPDGSVHWPATVTGWYWTPEAELVANDPEAEFLESWIFDEDNPADRPFAWLETYYARRQSAKRRGDRAEWVWKKIINSVYGQLARKSGWNRKSRSAPKSHKLEYAGYITSACRAAVYKAGILAGNGLVSIDTDGITTLSPIGDLDIGRNLGQWSEERYEDGLFWQSGIYFLKKEGSWKRAKAKTRGIPRGTYTAEEVIAEFEKTPEGKRETRKLKLTRQQFTGYRKALRQKWTTRNTWHEDDFEFVFGGDRKRVHRPSMCSRRCGELPGGQLHRFVLSSTSVAYRRTLGLNWDFHSLPHRLPWIEKDSLEELLTADEYVVDLLNADREDIRWLRS